eukprot:gb/GECG01000547.1/.p1 GENE.gb/GECG01000547.1/~~gb/GECG01000547.1/.p1  ORF type:complete len:218 (+),score=23.63 gb/GECG01000547.1/:1-654(+)
MSMEMVSMMLQLTDTLFTVALHQLKGLPMFLVSPILTRARFSQKNDSGYPEILKMRTAGDFNGDGVDDLVATSPAYNPSKYVRGKFFIIFGSRKELPACVDVGFLDGSNGTRVTTPIAPNSPLWAIGIGDFNGDNYDDILTNQWPSTNWTSSNCLIFGKSNSFLREEPNFDGYLFWYGDSDWGNLVGLGDVNNDGLADIRIRGTGVFGKKGATSNEN